MRLYVIRYSFYFIIIIFEFVFGMALEHRSIYIFFYFCFCFFCLLRHTIFVSLTTNLLLCGSILIFSTLIFNVFASRDVSQIHAPKTLYNTLDNKNDFRSFWATICENVRVATKKSRFLFILKWKTVQIDVRWKCWNRDFGLL